MSNNKKHNNQTEQSQNKDKKTQTKQHATFIDYSPHLCGWRRWRRKEDTVEKVPICLGECSHGIGLTMSMDTKK